MKCKKQKTKKTSGRGKFKIKHSFGPEPKKHSFKTFLKIMANSLWQTKWEYKCRAMDISGVEYTAKIGIMAWKMSVPADG